MTKDYKKSIGAWKRDRVGGWIGVDLDGTLAHHGEWKGPYHVGPPVPKMLERVKKWLSEGVEVRILTARATKDMSGQADPAVIIVIENWCILHLGQKLQVTNEKTYDMIALYDDRAVQIVPNTGDRADSMPEECCWNGQCPECLP